LKQLSEFQEQNFDNHNQYQHLQQYLSYEECLFYELQNEGFKVEKQKALPLVYKEVRLDVGYRIDLLVEDRIIVEIKSVDSLNEIHLAQILTYMKLSGCKLGLLVNFNVKSLKNGIKRVIL